MKYRINIPEDIFQSYSPEKQKKYLFLLLKEIEQSTSESFENFKQDLLRLITISELNLLKQLNTEISRTICKEQLLNISFDYFSEDFYAEKDFHFLRPAIPIKIKTADSPLNKKIYPLTLLLHNLRSAFNVGAIIRSAECFGVEKVIFTGHSPLPDHPKVIQTSMNTHSQICWEKSDSIKDVILKYRNEGYTIYALETAEPSVSLNTHHFQGKILLIAGNEALGIEKEVLGQVDHILQIPLHGWKNSLNVGTATAIACYEIVRQFQLEGSL